MWLRRVGMAASVAGLALWLAFVLQVTLIAAGGGGGSQSLCLFCGERGVADALLNTVFFAPLGIGLSILGVRAGRVVLVGFLLSSGIEVAQLFLPGRHPTLGDVVWNTAGGLLGVALIGAVAARTFVQSDDDEHARRLARFSSGYGLVLAAAMLASAWLLGPTPTDDRYFGQWTPDLAFMPIYDGEVLQASLDGEPIPPGAVYPSGADPRAAMLGDWTIETSIIVGGPPREVAPIVSIYDASQREVVLIGAIGNDVVVRERRRSADWGLDRPDVRGPSLFVDRRVGDTLRMIVRRRGPARCVEVEGAESCTVGFTAGRGWSLLLSIDGASEPIRQRVDRVWLFLLFLPLGFLFRGTRVGWVSVAGVVASLGAVGLTPHVGPLPGALWATVVVALAVGVLLGWSSNGFFRRARPTAHPPSDPPGRSETP